MAEQGLHDCQVDSRLGQGGPEGVAQRVRMPGCDPGDLPVIPEDRAQRGRCRGCPRLGPLAAMNSRALAVSGRSASR